MSRLLATATLMLVTLGTAAGAAGVKELGRASECSAAGLAAAQPVPGLPRRVASMRLRIDAAARRCDFGALARLAHENGRGLEFSFGAERSPAAFWRKLERRPERPRPMEALVKILKMPFVHDGRFYSWPSAHQRRPKERDWRALRTLYTERQIAAMRRGGIGYLGYRAGFTASGDWQFFVAGD
jgi:hypothetical protein